MARFQLTGPDVVGEEFDGEVVVLNLKTGQYFGLNESGVALWSAILAGADPADIAGISGSEFAAHLVELGLISQSAEPPVPAEKLTLDGAPRIDVYDDLSDLILADPIHDVDTEKGWPKLPDSA
ncbi:MAG: PqqD family protein [Octadecabacter sp.]